MESHRPGKVHLSFDQGSGAEEEAFLGPEGELGNDGQGTTSYAAFFPGFTGRNVRSNFSHVPTCGPP